MSGSPNRRIRSALAIAATIVSALLAAVNPAAGVQAEERSSFANGDLEGAPSRENGFRLYYEGSRVAAHSYVTGNQSVDLSGPAAPQPWSALGLILLYPDSHVRLHQVRNFSFWMDVPRAPLFGLSLQFYMSLDADQDGDRDFCLIHSGVGTEMALGKSDGWESRLFNQSTKYHPSDADCSGGVDSLELETIQSLPSHHFATVMSVAVQTVTAAPLWPDGFPTYVDAFRLDLAPPGNDLDLDGDAVPDAVDPDQDGDGFEDANETASGSDPRNSASVPPDLDGDRVPNEKDNCPTAANPSQADSDQDGIGETCDEDPEDGPLGDEDGDNFTNREEAIAGSDRSDSASTPEDRDADGALDADDNCADISNPSQADGDHDGAGDACDANLSDGPEADPDGDGYSNHEENFAESDPNRGASTPNDADGDGVRSLADNCPNHRNLNQADADGDDRGDACDADPKDGPEGDLDGDGASNRVEYSAGSDARDASSLPIEHELPPPPEAEPGSEEPPRQKRKLSAASALGPLAGLALGLALVRPRRRED